MSKSSMAIGICPIELFHRALNLERERLPNNMSHDLNAQLRSPSTISYMKKSYSPSSPTVPKTWWRRFIARRPEGKYFCHFMGYS